MSTHKPQTKQEAHEKALTDNVYDQYTLGEQIDLVVIDSPDQNNGREAFARHNDVSVFIYPSGINLHAGTHVRAKVSERGENHLKAVALAVIG